MVVSSGQQNLLLELHKWKLIHRYFRSRALSLPVSALLQLCNNWCLNPCCQSRSFHQLSASCTELRHFSWWIMGQEHQFQPWSTIDRQQIDTRLRRSENSWKQKLWSKKNQSYYEKIIPRFKKLSALVRITEITCKLVVTVSDVQINGSENNGSISSIRVFMKLSGKRKHCGVW